MLQTIPITQATEDATQYSGNNLEEIMCKKTTIFGVEKSIQIIYSPHQLFLKTP